jgi:hypothetical protein
MHLAAATHDTPYSAPRVPAGAVTRQAWPSQLSASGAEGPVTELLSLPTARQLLAVGQEIPDRELPASPGLGVGIRVQMLPFHRSARVCPSAPPTAMQLAGPEQETPDRPSLVGRATVLPSAA